ncbi:hypothetical protein LXL04_030341 [Taraxacum kok-saghyz]
MATARFDNVEFIFNKRICRWRYGGDEGAREVAARIVVGVGGRRQDMPTCLTATNWELKFITRFKRYHSSEDCLPTKFPISPSRPLKLPVPAVMGQKRSKIKC